MDPGAIKNPWLSVYDPNIKVLWWALLWATFESDLDETVEKGLLIWVDRKTQTISLQSWYL